MSKSIEKDRRSVKRLRPEEIETVIIDTVFEDLQKHGFRAVTVESISAAASGVNFIDLYVRERRYANPVPFIPGQEASGTIAALGEGVRSIKEGDRVAWCSILGTLFFATRTLSPVPKSRHRSCTVLALPRYGDHRRAATEAGSLGNRRESTCASCSCSESRDAQGLCCGQGVGSRRQIRGTGTRSCGHSEFCRGLSQHHPRGRC